MKITHQKNKIVIACLILVVAGFYVYSVKSHNDQAENKNNLNENLILSPRNQSIKDYLSGKKQFTKVSYDGQEFSVVVYKDSEGVWDIEKKKEIHNHSDFPYDRPGIILFD